RRAGGGPRIRSESVLRFCTIAARWNSSRAPESPVLKVPHLAARAECFGCSSAPARALAQHMRAAYTHGIAPHRAGNKHLALRGLPPQPELRAEAARYADT